MLFIIVFFFFLQIIDREVISSGSIFDDNHISPFVIGQNQWRERKKENKKKVSCFKNCKKVVLQILFL